MPQWVRNAPSPKKSPKQTKKIIGLKLYNAKLSARILWIGIYKATWSRFFKIETSKDSLTWPYFLAYQCAPDKCIVIKFS